MHSIFIQQFTVITTTANKHHLRATITNHLNNIYNQITTQTCTCIKTFNHQTNKGNTNQQQKTTKIFNQHNNKPTTKTFNQQSQSQPQLLSQLQPHIKESKNQDIKTSNNQTIDQPTTKQSNNQTIKQHSNPPAATNTRKKGGDKTTTQLIITCKTW